MVKIKATYEGELRVRAVHGPSGCELVTDAPVDNHGKGESFSPTDLIATGLGTCMLTIMGMLADRKGWAFAGSTAEVEKEMMQAPARRIARLTVVITVPYEHDEKIQKALERAALTCPVHKTLGDGLELPLRFVWGG